MWSQQAARIGDVAEELIVSVAWAQWGALSALVSRDERPATSMIDPESLLLMSILGSRKEKRLLDIAAGWLDVGSRLVSTQRARTIAGRFASCHASAIASVATIALKAGDHRWKKLVTHEGDEAASLIRPKSLGPLRLDAPPALMLRLRAGFGMGTKADALALLIGTGDSMPLRAIADNLSYGSRPLRLALEDMVLADLVRRLATSPVQYQVMADQWYHLLNGGHNGIPTTRRFPAKWQPWSSIAGFASQVIAWSEHSVGSEVGSAYVAASQSRDLLEGSLDPALKHRFMLRGPRSGQRWDLDSFEELVVRFDAEVREAI